MRIPLAIAVLLMVFSGRGMAQVTVEMVLDQEQFLRGESLPVKVRIINRSGQTLHLGGDKNWLSFGLEDNSGREIPRTPEGAAPGEFTLDSAKAATREVDLLPWFDLSDPGRYRLIATVRIKEWNEDFSSQPKSFEVVRGTKLWEQEFGIPGPANPPELRKYTLQQAKCRQRLMLYVRVTDLNENNPFRVSPLGPIVSFSQPEAQVDAESNLHVLFQSGARAFLFHVIDPSGKILLRQSYDYSNTRPILRAGNSGRIYVAGGTRRITEADIPPPERPPPATNSPATNQTAKPPKKAAPSSKP